jgi:hypothetical protein
MDRVKSHIPFDDYKAFEAFFAVEANREAAVAYCTTAIMATEQHFLRGVVDHLIAPNLLSNMYLKLQGDKTFHVSADKRRFPEGFVHFMVALGKARPCQDHDFAAAWPNALRKLTRKVTNARIQAGCRHRKKEKHRLSSESEPSIEREIAR